MNRNLLTMALLICGLSVNGQKKIDYVDPLIGTAKKWLANGAQPTEVVAKILKQAGIEK